MTTSSPPKPSNPPSPGDDVARSIEAAAEQLHLPVQGGGGSLWRRIARSFGFAFAGLFYLLRTQRNARIHCGFALLAIALGAWLSITRTQWAILALTIGLVLILEAMNTAIEAIVDLVSPTYHPLAKTAKDVAAAMVLIGAITSLAVGAAIFGPLIWHQL